MYAHTWLCYVNYMCQLISGHFAGFEQVRLSLDEVDTAAVLARLDQAEIIVALISVHFLQNHDLIELLQVAINRQRYSGKWLLVFIILYLFVNVFPTTAACSDIQI